MRPNMPDYTAANKAVVDSLMTVANTALAAAERVVSLNVDTVRALVEDQASHTKALLGAQNVNDAVNAAQKAMTPNPIEQAVNYSRGLYEISTLATEELTKLAQSQYGEFHSRIAEAMNPMNALHATPFDFAIKAIRDTMNLTLGQKK